MSGFSAAGLDPAGNAPQLRHRAPTVRLHPQDLRPPDAKPELKLASPTIVPLAWAHALCRPRQTGPLPLEFEVEAVRSEES